MKKKKNKTNRIKKGWKVMNLKDTEGNTFDIAIPAKLEHVTLPVGLSFTVAKRNIDDWLAKEVKAETIASNQNYYLYLLAEAISAFTKTDINVCLGWNVEDLLDETGGLMDGVLMKHIKEEKFEKDWDGMENMLLYVFNQIDVLMSNYKFKPFAGPMKFIHNGIRYQVPSILRILTLGKTIFGKIGTGQTVDIMKVKKYIFTVDGFQENIANKRNMVYSGYLQIMAILAIPEGKQYPLNPKNADIFVQENMVAFKDIPFKTGCDIVFFLTMHGSNSGMTLISRIILILQNLTLAMNQSD